MSEGDCSINPSWKQGIYHGTERIDILAVLITVIGSRAHNQTKIRYIQVTSTGIAARRCKFNHIAMLDLTTKTAILQYGGHLATCRESKKLYIPGKEVPSTVRHSPSCFV
jgi:hypothetical protein